MNELHLFAGIGGGILGGMLCGHTTVCAVEIEPYCRKVLFQRQRDGILPRFPIWDDIRTFDGKPWGGTVDIVSGGFPCQDISIAGRGAGLAGKRSGLWSEMARVVGEVRPKYVYVENSPMLTGRGLGQVLMDLAKMGYDAEWCVLGADDVGAPHVRKRIWILAYSAQHGRDTWRPSDPAKSKKRREFNRGGEQGNVSDSKQERLEGQQPDSGQPKITKPWDGLWWSTEPNVGRLAHRVAARVDRLKAIGNGQVPAVAALAWYVLINRIPK